MLLSIFGILIAVIIYLLSALTLSIIGTNPPEINCRSNNEIYISSNGIHLEIICPSESIDSHFVKELNISNQVNYVSFGWGDKSFYLETPTWDQLKWKVAIRAAFIKSETAMHVTCHYEKYESWIMVKICEEQLLSLINYVMNSFERNNNGQLIEIIGSGYTSHDKFYEANGNYSIAKTCNDWVNIGLKKSNIKTSIWSPFDYGVLYHVNKESSPN